MCRYWFLMFFIAFIITPLVTKADENKITKETKLVEIRVEKAWTRATPSNAHVGGAYVTIHNDSKTIDRLLSAHSPIAERVEIHTMKVSHDGIMSMRPLADGITIKPQASFIMQPGGYHLMLMGLREPIRQGKPIPITLKFQVAGDIFVEFIVMPLGAKDFQAGKKSDTMKKGHESVKMHHENMNMPKNDMKENHQ